MKCQQHILALTAVHLSATASVRLTMANPWETSFCEQYMAGQVPQQCVHSKVSTSFQLVAEAGPIWVSETPACCDCSLLSLCDSSQTLHFSIDTFSVHHNLSLFCRLASLRVKCFGCLKAASGTLTPPRLSESASRFTLLAVPFYSSLVYLQMVTQQYRTEQGQQVTRSILMKGSLSALSESYLLANLFEFTYVLQET